MVFMTKKFYKIIIINLCILLLFVFSILLMYKYRFSVHRALSQYHLYHELKRGLFFYIKHPDENRGMKYYYNEEVFGRNKSQEVGLKWWFRPSHVGTFSAPGLVDDTDHDGRPEVFMYGGSKNIYCLDGGTGELIWRFELPFGRVGALAATLEDANDDGANELIVGSHTHLPIRVYCLNTQKSPRKRILWYTNVHGDFIQGGIVSFRNKQKEVRVVAGTRDAPYSRGTLNVLDGRGKYIYPPIYGIDMCNNRPTIGDINNDGDLDMIVGSHNFYGAKYGHKVNVFNVETGNLIWSKPMEFDTGYMQFPIVDINNNNKYVVLAGSFVLNAQNGDTIYDFSKENKFGLISLSYVLQNNRDKSIYFGDTNKIVDAHTEKLVYKFNSFPRGAPGYFLDLDGDGCSDFLNAYLVFERKLPKVKFYLFDAFTGQLKDTVTINIDQSAFKVLQEYLPCQQEVDNYISGISNFDKQEHEEKTDMIKKFDKFNQLSFILADTDGDMHWEALVNFNSIVLCFDLPFIIFEKYNSFRYRKLTGDPLEDQSGFNYDLPNRAFKHSD